MRRYVVYIEGKPLTIAEGPPDKAPSDDTLVLRVDDPDEIAASVRTLAHSPRLLGVHLFHVDVDRLWEAFKAPYKFVAAAGGAVVDEKGRLLVIRRLGKWDLPKGKVDPGEGLEEAALREVREECGLERIAIAAELPCTWHTYERKGKQHLKRTDWYLMNGSSKERLVPQTDEDIEEVRWMDRAAVAAMKEDTYPSLLPVITAWEAGR